jgi:hypothetical protein
VFLGNEKGIGLGAIGEAGLGVAGVPKVVGHRESVARPLALQALRQGLDLQWLVHAAEHYLDTVPSATGSR